MYGRWGAGGLPFDGRPLDFAVNDWTDMSETEPRIHYENTLRQLLGSSNFRVPGDQARG